MRLSAKAKARMDEVVEQFKSGNLGPVVEIAKIKLPEDAPAAKWSFSNRTLAYIQTGSLDCRGYRQWQKVGRHVKKGARAAFIFIPRLITVEEDGKEQRILTGFIARSVFAYEDTEGEEGSFHYEPRELPPLSDLAQQFGIKLAWVPLGPEALGSCTVDGDEIRVGSPDPAVFFHELAHAVDAKLNGKLKGGQHTDQETVAELTATVLAAMYGYGDRTGNCWQYISQYAKDPLLAILKALKDVEMILDYICQEAMVKSVLKAA